MIGQAATPAAQHATELSNTELAAVSGIVALVLIMALALVAYAIKGQRLNEIAGVGTFTVVGQLVFSLVVIYVLALLMLKKVVDAEAGLPILAGLAGVIVGKARGGASGDSGGGAPSGGGGSESGGGGAGITFGRSQEIPAAETPSSAPTASLD